MIRMKRKFINVVLGLIVFLTTTGFTVSLHYCCDFLVEIDVNSNATPCCPAENGCCDYEVEYVQFEGDLSTPISDNFQNLKYLHHTYKKERQ